MSKYIVILCTLDTKGEEANYLQELIKAKGMNTVLLDTGFGGEPSVPADISAGEIAKAGGGDISEIRASKDTGTMTPIM
jgi:uncharacterized protein (UPF0261 family)